MDSYKKFNKCTKQMYKDLLVIFPNESIFTVAETAFIILKQINKESPAVYFYENAVIPYGEHIINKDASFIYDEKTTLAYFQICKDRLIKFWEALSDENKNIIWDYLNVLIVMCKDTQVR